MSALTKVSRQLDVSMGNMMGLVNGFAVAIFLVLIYLLSKIIIEKNAQSISMAKILGYTDGEIGRLYILSTSIVVILCLLFSFPIEETFMKIIFREMMLVSISGWITLWIDPMIYVEMFVIGAVTYAVVAALEYRKIQKVPMDEALKNVKVLSGGEKVRCVLSKLMLSGANFLIFDEPTNHLDMESITALNEGMERFKGNMIFASHDHQLMQTVANRIIDIKKDGSVVDKECTYNEYLGLE